MTEKEQAFLNNFAINEGAYFYKKNFRIDNREIKKLFAIIKENAHSHFPIVEIIKQPIYYSDGCVAYVSLKVFRDETIPLFIKDLPDEFIKKEVHICYFLMLDIKDYIILFSRHANGIAPFKSKHNSILGNVLAGSLVNDDTVFTQMRMGNMNLNPYALRNKSYESDDLSQSMPTFGSGQHVLKTTRIQNNDEIITLGLSTSRISKIGGKRKTILSLCKWADNIIEGIDHPYNVNYTLMGQFSTPIKWKEYKNSLLPTYIMIDFHELTNKIQRENLTIQYRNRDNIIIFESNNFLGHLKRSFSGCKSLIEHIPHEEYLCEDSYGLLKIRFSNSGINLKGVGRLDNLYLVSEDGITQKLISYINSLKCFYIGFEDIQFIYQGNSLHQDGNILNSIDSILSVFKGIPEMENVLSEKGHPTEDDDKFANDTVFNVVENIFDNENASHVICDDLGYECADHIVLSDNRISFIHSKAKGKTMLSASAFQEVIGQALKNIGNLRNLKAVEKVNSWRGKFYKQTLINVCRKGNLDTFENTYNRIISSPNGIKEICLAIDFVSLKELRQALIDLRDGRPLRQKHSVAQLIWLLSAFISSCKDADIQCRIFCRE